MIGSFSLPSTCQSERGTGPEAATECAVHVPNPRYHVPTLAHLPHVADGGPWCDHRTRRTSTYSAFAFVVLNAAPLTQHRRV